MDEYTSLKNKLQGEIVELLKKYPPQFANQYLKEHPEIVTHLLREGTEHLLEMDSIPRDSIEEASKFFRDKLSKE
ncbi:MAG: hypothetical protein GTN38_01015 [Candidatus Aenigmarchaeota archaeon]|nr:hypothetical protein [Candidatus Aenigmarchaeota archaeon]NIP40168.1 hypothetical protein [Candidatus Aenigmarchaeota archaeon]NIQ17212.1 hypothetical protein [Candidatus Aenigmarchaeota archaeon]NIS73002.1 hypothetical protein [Candidatus Aenigmarchaeota archaeon]